MNRCADLLDLDMRAIVGERAFVRHLSRARAGTVHAVNVTWSTGVQGLDQGKQWANISLRILLDPEQPETGVRARHARKLEAIAGYAKHLREHGPIDISPDEVADRIFEILQHEEPTTSTEEA